MPRRINDPERNHPQPSPGVVPGTLVLCPPDDLRRLISPQENRGDFNDNANPLWTLYSEKAKDHDEAKIDTLTEGMNGVLLFVRSHSSHPTNDYVTDYDLLGWLVCCCSYPFYRRPCSDHTSNPYTADCIL
jgi:hypothetical protein